MWRRTLLPTIGLAARAWQLFGEVMEGSTS